MGWHDDFFLSSLQPGSSTQTATENGYTNRTTGDLDGEYAVLHRPHVGSTSTYAQLGNSGPSSEPPHVPTSTYDQLGNSGPSSEPPHVPTSTRTHTSAYAEPYAFLRSGECKELEDNNDYASVEFKDQTSASDTGENEQTYFVLEKTSSDSNVNEDPSECNLRDKE